LLQWGHGISAVEVNWNNQTERQEVMLQWGHGISAVEVTEIQRDATTDRIASMGPRHFSRGSSDAAKTMTAISGRLQWGHGISAVEVLVWQDRALP